MTRLSLAALVLLCGCVAFASGDKPEVKAQLVPSQPSVTSIASFLAVVDSLGYTPELFLFARQPVSRAIDMATGGVLELPAVVPVTEDSSWVAELGVAGDAVTICFRRREP